MRQSSDPTPDPDTAPDSRSGSALAVAERVFLLLQRGPTPLSLDPRELCAADPSFDPVESGVDALARDEPVSLWSLREMIVGGQLPLPVINQTWSVLVHGVRAHGESWTVATVGMALPALFGMAKDLGGSPWRRVSLDLDAEILSGFLAGLALVNPTARAIFPFLLRHARVAGLAAIAAHRAAGETTLVAPTDLQGLTHQPEPSTEQILASAVNAGVLTSADAGLILATRVEGLPAVQVATASRLSYEAMHKRRRRAERRLATYLGARSQPATRRTTSCVDPRTHHPDSGADTNAGPAPLPANGGRR